MNDHSEQVALGSVLITVNQRLARHHLMRFQRWQLAQGRQWWETPAILPMGAWLRSLHAQALAAGLVSRTLLPDLLQQRTWRRCIEADFGLTLLDVEATTVAARQAWELACAWQVRHSQDDYLSLDQYTWQRWCSRYQRVLEHESWIDDASLPELMIELLALPEAAALLPDSVILEGFLELPAQLQQFVQALQRAGIRVEYPSRTADAVVHHVTHADDDQELLAIATHMRKELEHDAALSLGLVVPDLQKRRAAVVRAFDRVFFPCLSPDEIRQRGRPYDFSLGMPLQDTAVVMAALCLLKLSVSSIRGSELSAVLLSPYLEAATSEARRREQLDRRLRDQRVRSLTLETLQQHLYSGSRLNRCLTRLLKRRRLGKTTLSDWASRFSDWLRILGWPGESVDSEEYQAVSAWLECLDDLQLLDDGERVDASFAVQLVQRLASNRIFQLDTPNTPIQIMGRLESHGIAFDCLWVAGLDSEQWPPPGSPSPFLSIARQKLQGVPGASANARLSLATNEFLLWSSQAPLLIASHVLVREGKALSVAALPQVHASEANQQLAGAALARMARLPSAIDPLAHLQDALVLETIVDDHGPALESGSKVRGGARLFENQALCPFRAFALHRLQIQPLEEAGLGLDPRQHGTLLHRALELFWESVRSHDALMRLESEALDNEVQRCVALAIDELKVPAELCELEQTRLSSLLTEWLIQCEAPRQAFEIVELEQRHEVERDGIVMNVMIDRIDRVGDTLVVVDYKTGTANQINTWADERIVNPQLPLYVLTNDEIQGATFAQVARNQCAFKGVASDESLLPRVKTSVLKSRVGQATSRPLENWNDWREHWRESLDRIAAEVRQGLATVTPMKTACMYCELKSLCRVDEAALASTEELTSELVDEPDTGALNTDRAS